MRKFVNYIKGFPQRLRDQWKNLFNSKHRKMTEGAYQEYKSHPHRARGDNWRRPDENQHSENHHSNKHHNNGK